MVLSNRYRTVGAAAGKPHGQEKRFAGTPEQAGDRVLAGGQWDSNKFPMGALVGEMEAKRTVEVGERDGDFHILMA